LTKFIEIFLRQPQECQFQSSQFFNLIIQKFHFQKHQFQIPTFQNSKRQMCTFETTEQTILGHLTTGTLESGKVGFPKQYGSEHRASRQAQYTNNFSELPAGAAVKHRGEKL
jgi:hypothetical protein